MSSQYNPHLGIIKKHPDSSHQYVPPGQYIPSGVSRGGAAPPVPGPRPVVSSSGGQFNGDLSSMLFASDSEFLVESLDSDKKFCVGAFRNGLWEKRTTPVGEFTHRLVEIQLNGLTESCEADFEPSLPKIPGGIAAGIVEFYRLIMDQLNGAEAMVQIWWNIAEKKYFTYVPVQTVGPASVSFTHNVEMNADANLVWALDTH